MTSQKDESTRQIGATEALMIQYGIPLTRENWIELAYLGNPPEEWSQELEEQLPPHLQSDDWIEK